MSKGCCPEQGIRKLSNARDCIEDFNVKFTAYLFVLMATSDSHSPRMGSCEAELL